MNIFLRNANAIMQTAPSDSISGYARERERFWNGNGGSLCVYKRSIINKLIMYDVRIIINNVISAVKMLDSESWRLGGSLSLCTVCHQSRLIPRCTWFYPAGRYAPHKNFSWHSIRIHQEPCSVRHLLLCLYIFLTLYLLLSSPCDVHPGRKPWVLIFSRFLRALFDWMTETSSKMRSLTRPENEKCYLRVGGPDPPFRKCLLARWQRDKTLKAEERPISPPLSLVHQTLLWLFVF